MEDVAIEVSKCGKLLGKEEYSQERGSQKMALHDYERKTIVVVMQQREQQSSRR
jgi:hypothetical protein